ncbi:hypothetical protein ACKWTF_014373 [Chironomus riparius]
MSVLFCVLTFPIILNDDASKPIPHLFHAIAGIIDLLIYSYGGQKVMDSAVDVCKDCYDAEKMIVMLRTKHDVRIESVYYDASLPTFSLMIGRTMSLIAVLKSFL